MENSFEKVLFSSEILNNSFKVTFDVFIISLYFLRFFFIIEILEFVQ